MNTPTNLINAARTYEDELYYSLRDMADEDLDTASREGQIIITLTKVGNLVVSPAGDGFIVHYFLNGEALIFETTRNKARDLIVGAMDVILES